MRSGKFQFNRRVRLCLHRATGALSLAIWLFMAAAEIHPPLHAWLHGGTIPDNDDDCAIVAIAHGKIEAVPLDVPAVLPVTWIEIAPRAEIFIFVPVSKNLPNDRAPPFFCSVS
jgi:hypothetical protein